MGRRIYRRSSLCLRHSWPHRSGPRKGPFFYGLGGPPLWDRQIASELEKGPDHIPDATKMVANFTFPFGILFSLALAAVIGPVESITSFPPSGLAEISRHHLTSGLNSTGVVSSRSRLPTHLELARATQVAFGAPCKSIG